jgi:2-oxo-4-hydroxy-4-carboxy-5-ureidoimidazoline decarboxylase
MLNLKELNAASDEEFTARVGHVFEHSPWVAERTVGRRPFAGIADLHGAMCETVRGAGVDEQLALIRAHPDLVGRAALTSESQSEQTSAGLGDLSREEVECFQEFNSAYRERFGFPFVICARINKKEAILRAFPERLENPREKEIETALAEIYKIAELRLRDLIQ